MAADDQTRVAAFRHLSRRQREHLRDMIDPDSGAVLFWHPRGAERRTVDALCRLHLLRAALGPTHGSVYELTEEGERVARHLAWRGVYPGYCIDPEDCRGYSHCPRRLSCVE